MRVILVAIGSRGDVEPYCALTKELLLPAMGDHQHRHHHSVDFVVQSNWKPLVANSFLMEPKNTNGNSINLRLHELPFNSHDFYRVQQQQQHPTQEHEDPRMSSVGTVANIIRYLVLPCWKQLSDIVVENGESSIEDTVVVTGSFARQLCLLVAKRYNLPVVILHLQPLVPNNRFPNYRVSTTKFVQAILYGNGNIEENRGDAKSNNYEETYWRLENALEEFFLKDALSEVCKQIGCVEPYSWRELQNILTGQSPRHFIANAYSNHLIPTLGKERASANLNDVGPLADSYLPPSFDANARAYYDSILEKFQGVSEGPPICIGFGSMQCSKISVIFEALERLNERAILVGGAPIHTKHSRVLHLPNTIPYPYLLPRCSAMLCHGGAGVVQACLAAGIPCWICPAMGDQFAFAELVQAMGYGVRCTKMLKDLTAEDIVNTYQDVMACRGTCHALAAKIRKAESGTSKLVKLLERHVKYQ